MRKNGFTMIEFMVVIVIIAILATLGGGAYSKSLKKGRDVQRVEDLKEIQKGFESYYSKIGNYTDSSRDMFEDDDIFPGGEIVNKSTDVSYTYTDESVSSYCVCVPMESIDGEGNYIFANSGENCDFAAGAKNNYCVSNVQ